MREARRGRPETRTPPGRGAALGSSSQDRQRDNTGGFATPQAPFDPFKIVITNWGARVAVSVEPRQVDKPSRPFRTASDAMAFAQELSRAQGWPIEDRRQPRHD